MRHANLIRSIESEIESLKNLEIAELNFELGSYTDAQNQIRPCFILNDEGMLQMLNKESAIVRCKTIKLIKELKEENARLQQQLQNQKPQLTLEQELVWNLYNGGIDAVTAHKKLLELETKELNDKIEEQQEEIETTITIGRDTNKKV